MLNVAFFFLVGLSPVNAILQGGDLYRKPLKDKLLIRSAILNTQHRDAELTDESLTQHNPVQHGNCENMEMMDGSDALFRDMRRPKSES